MLQKIYVAYYDDERFIFTSQNGIYDPKMPQFKYWYLLLLAVLILASVSVLVFMGGGLSGITGNLLSRVFVTLKVKAACPILLVPGWNLFSVYCETDNMGIDHIFSSNGTNLTLYSYDPTDINDSWKVYRGDLPDWVVLDLHNISVKQGYWINTWKMVNLTLNGTFFKPNFIDLNTGWNLVGFPINASQPISEAIGDSAPNLLTIHKYEPLSPDHWKVYSSSLPVNDLEEMEPNYGYWINMNGSAIWIIE